MTDLDSIIQIANLEDWIRWFVIAVIWMLVTFWVIRLLFNKQELYYSETIKTLKENVARLDASDKANSAHNAECQRQLSHQLAKGAAMATAMRYMLSESPGTNAIALEILNDLSGRDKAAAG